MLRAPEQMAPFLDFPTVAHDFTSVSGFRKIISPFRHQNPAKDPFAGFSNSTE